MNQRNPNEAAGEYNNEARVARVRACLADWTNAGPASWDDVAYLLAAGDRTEQKLTELREIVWEAVDVLGVPHLGSPLRELLYRVIPQCTARPDGTCCARFLGHWGAHRSESGHAWPNLESEPPERDPPSAMLRLRCDSTAPETWVMCRREQGHCGPHRAGHGAQWSV